MSAERRPMSERELWIGLTKVVVGMAGILLLIAIFLALVFHSASEARALIIGAFLLAVGLSFLANGVLAVLRIIDWFEARRKKEGGH